MTVGESESHRVILALDLPDRDQTLRLARSVVGECAMVKVGFEGFVAHGAGLVRELVALGLHVFLDLKLHDIPRTVAAATRAVSTLGAGLVTVHASGGPEMVRAAKESAGESMQVAAVTVLTSLDDAALCGLGLDQPLAGLVRRWGESSLDAGADALVSSAWELATLAGLPGERIVPGVRPAGSALGDQKRVVTPTEAVAQGASYIVVGRPVLQADDPLAALRAINEAIRSPR